MNKNKLLINNIGFHPNLIKKDWKQIFIDFESIYSMFCALTSALYSKRDLKYLLEIIDKDNNQELTDKNISVWSNEKFRNLKNMQENIIESLNIFKGNCKILISEKLNLEKSDLNVKCPILKNDIPYLYNPIFSPCFMQLLDNCLDVLFQIFNKNLKMFDSLIKQKSHEKIILQNFRKNLNKLEDLGDFREEFLFVIHEFQTKLEKTILLLKYICKLSKQELIFWLRNNAKYN